MSATETILRRWSTLTATAALVCAAWLASIPADPKNAVLLGMSASRLAGVGLLLAVGAGLSLLALRPPGSIAKVIRGSRMGGLVIPLWAAGLAAATFAGYAQTTAPEMARPVLERLAPIAAFAGFGLLLGALLLVLPRFSDPHASAAAPRPEGGRPRTPTLPTVVFLLVFTAAWLPRGLDLDRFVTVDEPTWLERSAGFFVALNRGELRETFQAEHPGVTLMWAGSLGYWWRLGGALDLPNEPDLGPQGLENFLAQRGFTAIDQLASARLFIVLAASLAIGLSGAAAARIAGPAAGLAGGLLVALDPFLLAHTRLLTMDGLLATFMALSVLAYLAHLHTGRRSDLLLSGAAAGLSWLTKTPGLFLVPMVGALGLAAALAGPATIPLGRRLFRLAAGLAAWGVVGGLIFLALFPALWAAPFETLGRMVSQTLAYAAEGHLGPVFYAGEIYPDGRITGAGFAVVNFLWRTTLPVLAGLGAVVWLALRDRPAARLPGQLLLAAAVFILLQSAGTKKFDRYFLPAFPLVDAAAGIGLAAAAAALRNRPESLRAAGAALAAAAALWPVAATYPYFLSHYNPLLGGARHAPETMMIGWGEGLDEAGRYLSSLPEPGELQVIAWYNRGSFSYFFDGESTHLPVNQEPSPERLDEILQMDYAVIYVHQWQRGTPANLLAILEPLPPERIVRIDGIDYVRIYRLAGRAADNQRGQP